MKDWLEKVLVTRGIDFPFLFVYNMDKLDFHGQRQIKVNCKKSRTSSRSFKI